MLRSAKLWSIISHSAAGNAKVPRSLRKRPPRSANRRALAIEPLEVRRLLSVNVTTARYGLSQDAANTSETVLTPSNVNVNSFGKIASMTVDAQVYAQPLVMTSVAVTGYGTRNVLYVATENDTVYALDARGNNPGQGYLWKTSLLGLDVAEPGETAIASSDYKGYSNVSPIVGITSTPVIDPLTDTIYVLGCFAETNKTYQQRLYALDITDGAVKFGGPVLISATVPGTGYDSSGGMVTFNPIQELQRPALTLANGEVYIAWSSNGDTDPYHGWVMAYNAATLHQDYVWCDTPNAQEAGIWMSGGGIAVDSSGNLYLTTGNGSFDANTGGSDYGMAVVKLSPSLQVEDYFAPYNEASLSAADLDYGCAGAVLLPTQSSGPPSEVLSVGKWGTIYLNSAATGQMGEFTAGGPNNDLGQANITANVTQSNVHNTLAYWNGSVYLGGDGLAIEAFAASNGTLGTTPTSASSHVYGNQGGTAGAGLTVSANGNSNGILWALDNNGGTSNPAVLYAYDATNLHALLWTSSSAPNGRDTCGNANRFQTPVVANGCAYVAGANSVTIYGLLPAIVTVASASPAPVTAKTTGLSVSASDPAGDLPPVYTWAVTRYPSGATLPTFSVNGTGGANVTTASFFMAGNYTFACTITDPTTGASNTSSVNVTVDSTLTSNLTVSPSTVTVVNGGSLQFVSSGIDQFGKSMTPQLNWAVNPGGAGGTIDSNGLYTAPSSATGADTVAATSGTFSAGAAVTVVPRSTVTSTVAITTPAAANPAVAGTSTALSVGGVDAAGDAAPTYSWAATFMPGGATAPTFSVNNSASANATTATITQAGTYGFTATVTDPTSGATALSSAKVVANFGLFTNSADIGGPLPAGSLSYNPTSGAYTTTAGGADIWNTSDQFHYTYESFAGNGQITARVTSINNSNVWAKAGPMFRDSAAANGAFADMVVTPGEGVSFQWRSTDGGNPGEVQVTGVTAPVWLRLTQVGGQFSGYYSLDDVHWTQVGTSQGVAMPTSDLAGLAVTSHSQGASTTAAIDNVSVNAAPTVATFASASPATVTSTTTNLSVLGADAAGEGNLTYAWTTFDTLPAPVGFSSNGANASKNTTVTFSKAGLYNFKVTITNASGLSVTSTVGVTVNPTYSGLSISPAAPNLTGGASQQFTATALDQFGQALASQPPVTWTLNSGPGLLTAGGLYTPPYASGSAVVQAASGGYSNTATVTFSSQAQWDAAADGSSSWTATGNWKDAATDAILAAPGVRGLAGDTVLFGSTALAMVTLDGANPTLAAITFSSAAPNYTLAQGQGADGGLTLQSAVGATVTVQAGSQVISAAVHLASSTTLNVAVSTQLTMSGPIDGNGRLTMTGNGRLVLNGSNTFSGGLDVQSGIVAVSSAGALLTGSRLIVGAGGPFNNNLAVHAAVAARVDGPARTTAAASSAAKSLSPRVVAAVMADSPPVSVVPPRAAIAMFSAARTRTTPRFLPWEQNGRLQRLAYAAAEAAIYARTTSAESDSSDVDKPPRSASTMELMSRGPSS